MEENADTNLKEIRCEGSELIVLAHNTSSPVVQ